MQLKPTSLSKDQVLKIVKVIAWVALSGAVAAVISLATDNKEAFGVFWPIVNVVLVALKQVFTPKQ